jgi:insulysin
MFRPCNSSAKQGRACELIRFCIFQNLQSDGFRVFQLEKSRANPAHPFHKFGTGNLKTLLHGEDPSTGATAVRNALLGFHKTFYTSDRMYLCVYGAQPLDVLQQWVAKHYLAIPLAQSSMTSSLPSSVISAAPFPPQAFASEIVLAPVRDLRQLLLWWPIQIPNARARYMLTHMKPDVCVAHLLGHEGDGSLLALLRSKGWANGIGAAVHT